MQRADTDPTPIFEHFRGSYGTELLTAAVAHFDLFGALAKRPSTLAELGKHLHLAERPVIVLTTALRGMGLLELNAAGELSPTAIAREHLLPGGPLDVTDYIGLAASSPGVLEMVERLKTNRPAGLDGDDAGAAFIYRAGMKSAMEQEDLARHFTMALAGRAKNVAPVLAEKVPLADARMLLDVGGGTGIYSIAWLQQHPQLEATILDRPEVLRLAEEYGRKFGVSDRLHLLPGDMFEDQLPTSDVILLSNILHDWDVPTCRELIARCAAALIPGGRLIVHDVLLNDDLSGPLPVALYSAALFTFCEGRAYSGKEYREWLTEVGLTPESPVSTLIHCQAIVASKDLVG
jgi:predicted O-methyltransferase YrrM